MSLDRCGWPAYGRSQGIPMRARRSPRWFRRPAVTLAAGMISAVGAVSAAATEPAGTRVTLAVTLPSGATVPGAGEIVANDHDRRCPPGCAYAVPNGVPVVFH